MLENYKGWELKLFLRTKTFNARGDSSIDVKSREQDRAEKA